MKRHMIIWQIVLSYFFIVLIISMAIAVWFYRYNIRTIENTAKESLWQSCNNATMEIDKLVQSADLLSVDIITKKNFASSLRKLDDHEMPQDIVRTNLQSALLSAYSKSGDVYRIVAFTPNGNAVSFGQNDLTKEQIIGISQQKEWAELSVENNKSLLGSHPDPWVKQAPRNVISILRGVYDGAGIAGYLEVQLLTRDIENICNLAWNGNEIFCNIVNRDGQLIFSNLNSTQSLAKTLESLRNNLAWYGSNAVTVGDNFLSVCSSNTTDWKIGFILPTDSIFRSLNFSKKLIFIALVFLLLIMAMFFIAIAERITKPIANIVSQVEGISLQNLGAPFEYVKGGYEVEVLSKAFVTMKYRISDALEKEKTAEMLGTKKLFESLQSRIGPHFMYNTLSSIANMCESGHGESAAQACFSLASILRYDSNYATATVSILAEIHNLENYIVLMKARYLQRLEFNTTVQEEALSFIVPKLTIQPLVENAIKYSLSEKEKVQINLLVTKSGQIIIITVSDNGTGFEQNALERIDKTVASFLKDPASFSPYEHIGFGGMGLLGTLLRLYLQYGESFRFKIVSNSQSGSSVSLYIPT